MAGVGLLSRANKTCHPSVVGTKSPLDSRKSARLPAERRKWGAAVEQSSRSHQWLRTILSIGVVAAVFALHFRFVLVNFSLGATPFDTGWFAWLFAEGDPWLLNPRIISDISYYNTHITPY